MRIHLVYGGLNQLRCVAAATHPYALTSYLQFKGRKEVPDFAEAKAKGVELIIDSGLYSFMFGQDQGKLAPTYEAYRDYTRRYLDDMNELGYDGLLVETDAQRIIGVDATKRLREEFDSLGDRVMYVWHQPEGLDGLTELARERSLVAVGLPELRHIAPSGMPARTLAMDLVRRIRKATTDNQPRIHLLGCTEEFLLETDTVWSCDSLSWLSGGKFGTGIIYSPGVGLVKCSIRSPKFRKYMEMVLERFPQEAEAIRKREKSPLYYLTIMTSAFAFRQYQDRLDARFNCTAST